MKQVFFVLALLLGVAGYSQNEPQVYDSVLAKSLGADEYGMKSYVLAILKTGPYTTENKAERDSLFNGHFSNMQVMADKGQLVVAGPLGKNDKQYRGIFILNTTSIDDARKWLDNDSAIHAGIFEVEYFPWYGSAALPVHIPVHDKITKSKF